MSSLREKNVCPLITCAKEYPSGEKGEFELMYHLFEAHKVPRREIDDFIQKGEIPHTIYHYNSVKIKGNTPMFKEKCGCTFYQQGSGHHHWVLCEAHRNMYLDGKCKKLTLKQASKIFGNPKHFVKVPKFEDSYMYRIIEVWECDDDKRGDNYCFLIQQRLNTEGTMWADPKWELCRRHSKMIRVDMSKLSHKDWDKMELEFEKQFKDQSQYFYFGPVYHCSICGLFLGFDKDGDSSGRKPYEHCHEIFCKEHYDIHIQTVHVEVK